MHHHFRLLLTTVFFAAPLLLGVAACASAINPPAAQTCIGTERTAMEQLNCEFKDMTFDIETQVKEFTVAGELQQIKRIKLVEPEKALALLTNLAQKHVEFKVIRILMPGTVVTMEYRDDRINFQFDESGLPKNVSRG